MALIESLLRAHEEAVAAQRVNLDAQWLMRTFQPLLAAVRKVQGFQTRIDFTMDNLDACLDTENGVVTELPVDLRWMAAEVDALKVESMYLESVPEWIRELKRMMYLEMVAAANTSDDRWYWAEPELRRNEQLLGLPPSIGELHELRELRLEGLANVQELPEAMGRLTRLEVLSLETLGKLRTVPAWIGGLRSLKRLALKGLSKVEGLPEEICGLSSLESLYIRVLASLEALPEQVGQLIGLHELILREFKSLQVLPSSMGDLTNLRASRAFRKSPGPSAVDSGSHVAAYAYHWLFQSGQQRAHDAGTLLAVAPAAGVVGALFRARRRL